MADALSEGRDIAVLGQVKLERARHRLHDPETLVKSNKMNRCGSALGLRGGTDTRDGKTDVDGGTDTLEEAAVAR
jgi:hypothetical protein